MKRPYLNEDQRMNVRLNTFAGPELNFKLQFAKLLKSTYIEHGCFAMKRIESCTLREINFSLGLYVKPAMLEKLKSIKHDCLGYLFRWLTKTENYESN